MSGSNFNWVKYKGGKRGDHYAMHVRFKGEHGWSWRLFNTSDGWSITFGWLNQEIRMGAYRRTLEEAKAAAEVAALALGHRSA